MGSGQVNIQRQDSAEIWAIYSRPIRGWISEKWLKGIQMFKSQKKRLYKECRSQTALKYTGIFCKWWRNFVLCGCMGSTTINEWKLKSQGKDLQPGMSESRVSSLVKLGVQLSSYYLSTRTTSLNESISLCGESWGMSCSFHFHSVSCRMLALQDALWQEEESLVIKKKMFFMSCRDRALWKVFWEKLLSYMEG